MLGELVKYVKPANRSLLESLEEIEDMADELDELAGIHIDRLIVYYFWTSNLPREYESAVKELHRNDELRDREAMLGCLRVVEIVTQERRRRRAEASKRKGPTCYRCQKKGHIARNCNYDYY